MENGPFAAVGEGVFFSACQRLVSSRGRVRRGHGATIRGGPEWGAAPVGVRGSARHRAAPAAFQIATSSVWLASRRTSARAGSGHHRICWRSKCLV